MRLLITRPAEDAKALADELVARGHEVLLAPVMTIEAVPDAHLSLDDVQALVFTSANGVRAFARREISRALAVYAVGDATARAARDAGFAIVSSASGDVEDLARLIARKADPARGALLHVTGSMTAGDLAGRLGASGFTLHRATLYRAEPARALPAEAAEALRAGRIDGVLLFSPRTTQLFVTLARAVGSEALTGIAAYCLSPAVAAAAEPGRFARVLYADRPDQESLLARLGSRWTP